MSWQAAVHSAKGVKHIKMGTPCQDWGDCKILSQGQLIVGAVSDGMGSARHSEVGSQLAVEVALKELKQGNWQTPPQDQKQVRKTFQEILEAVRAALKDCAIKQDYSFEDLACTLLAFVATPSWLAAMQVGDGLIVVGTPEGNYQLLFKPDKGEFANETTPVTSSFASQEMQVCLKKVSYQFICAATDGIEDISLFKPEGWQPAEKFFRPLQDHMLSPKSLDAKREELIDFLNSENINNIS